MKYITVIFICLCIAFQASGKPIRVVFVNPATNESVFWNSVVSFMQAAADDLAIELEVKYSGNRYENIKNLEETIRSKNPPDYLVYMFCQGIENNILRQAEAKGIKSFVFNTDTLNPQIVGKPRGKYKHWIGHITPDDVGVGYKLAKLLIANARKKKLQASDGKIHLLGISGSMDSTAAKKRNTGLLKAVKEAHDVILDQVVYSDWSTEDAEIKAYGLMKRYPNAKVIWSAADEISLGILKAIRKSGKQPGKDVLTGGVDWNSDVFEYIKNGEYEGTYGKHFMEGGIALLLIYDYHHNHDFVGDLAGNKTDFSLIDKQNIDQFETLFSKPDSWQIINFKKLTKTHNKKLKTYDFSLKNLIQNISKNPK